MKIINKKFNFWFLLFIVNFIFANSLFATGPRIVPILFSSEKNEIFALDLPPFISTEINSGGLASEIINASLKNQNVEAIITTLPLSEMVKYYLLQENALSIVGKYFNFDEKEREDLIFIPIYLMSEQYLYYKPLHKDGFNLKNSKEYIYGAHKGESNIKFENIKYIKNISILKKLKNGVVDFTTLPILTAEWFIKKQFPKEKQNFNWIDSSLNEIPLSIIFNKKHKDGDIIAQKFKAGLLKIIESGEYIQIVKKYNEKIDNKYLNKLKKEINK